MKPTVTPMYPGELIIYGREKATINLSNQSSIGRCNQVNPLPDDTKHETHPTGLVAQLLTRDFRSQKIVARSPSSSKDEPIEHDEGDNSGLHASSTV